MKEGVNDEEKMRLAHHPQVATHYPSPINKPTLRKLSVALLFSALIFILLLAKKQSI
jgi:hypothetical protein